MNTDATRSAGKSLQDRTGGIEGGRCRLAAADYGDRGFDRRSHRSRRGRYTRYGTRGPVHDVPPTVKRRRRRRLGARNNVSVPRKSGTVPRRNAQVRRRKRPKPDVVEPVQVAAPEPVFASQLSEIEQIHLAAGKDATKIPHASLTRIDLLLREMAATGTRYRLPTWLTKSIRMRIRRAAARPEASAPKPKRKKPKAPRKPASRFRLLSSSGPTGVRTKMGP